MKLRCLAAAALLCAVATPAFAADTCTIREYNTLGAAHGVPAQIGSEPAVTDQVTPDFTSGSVQSNFFNPATTYVELKCNVQASYLVGLNPTAANTNMFVNAGESKFFGVPEGGQYKLSVHTNP